MKSYRVTWVIDVEAEGVQQAAHVAMRMQHADTTANAFTVEQRCDCAQRHTAEGLHAAVEVDLGDAPRSELAGALEDAAIESDGYTNKCATCGATFVENGREGANPCWNDEGYTSAEGVGALHRAGECLKCAAARGNFAALKRMAELGVVIVRKREVRS